MATLTTVTNKSTVLAVQQIQSLIVELNEAIERDPISEDLKSLVRMYDYSDYETVELTIKGYTQLFNKIATMFKCSEEVKQKALKLSELFKLFQE